MLLSLERNYVPSSTSVLRLNAGSLTTSSYVTRSSWSNTALCLARYLSLVNPEIQLQHSRQPGKSLSLINPERQPQPSRHLGQLLVLGQP